MFDVRHISYRPLTPEIGVRLPMESQFFKGLESCILGLCTICLPPNKF
jgi:hypothetical protein